VAILTETITRRRPRRSRTFELSAAEQSHVKKALRFIYKHWFKNWADFADQLGCYRHTVIMAAGKGNSHQSRPSIGLAVRAAQIAGVPVESILSGTWPNNNTCPRCGR
jgi:hypothetical protein